MKKLGLFILLIVTVLNIAGCKSEAEKKAEESRNRLLHSKRQHKESKPLDYDMNRLY